jgi:hypothetical protein
LIARLRRHLHNRRGFCTDHARSLEAR